ncbi:MAG: TetR family transcriptional regulator [Sphingomonadales bacterium]|nr:TetR family transcriptional regulator [Sphingomonadales bacterium]
MNPAEAPPSYRRDAEATRARILAAAQRAFSSLGYARAGIREIAALAGTSTTLLIRYYGSKAGLYEAALVAALSEGSVYALPREGFGAALVGQFLRADVEILPPAIIALAAGDREAAAITARVAAEHAIRPLAAWLGGADAEARAARIFMLTTSFVLYSRNLPVLELADPGHGTAAWLASTIQSIVDETIIRAP